MSVEQVKNNYRYLKEHMPRVNIHYAVKANPDERIIRTLKDLGSCFDVASDGEILQLQAMGIAGEKMVYANPVKPIHSIVTARQTGILNYMADSEPEIERWLKWRPELGFWCVSACRTRRH